MVELPVKGLRANIRGYFLFVHLCSISYLFVIYLYNQFCEVSTFYQVNNKTDVYTCHNGEFLSKPVQSF